MNRERLNYLLDTVTPYVEKMATAEQWTDSKKRHTHGGAVLNFNPYIDEDRTTGKPISEAYDCGFEACWAGWYKLLAERDGLIEEHELASWGVYQLADHFGIAESTASALFGSHGAGVEHDMNGGFRQTTTEVLQHRKAHLENLLAA